MSTKFDVFISYSWKSKPQVAILYKNLIDELGIKIWWDNNEIVGGSNLRQQICKGICESKTFLCCITEAYCESLNCQEEIEFARTLKKDFIVLMLEKIDIKKIGSIGMIINPYTRNNCYNYGDKWPNECLNEITRAIIVN